MSCWLGAIYNPQGNVRIKNANELRDNTFVNKSWQTNNNSRNRLNFLTEYNKQYEGAFGLYKEKTKMTDIWPRHTEKCGTDKLNELLAYNNQKDGDVLMGGKKSKSKKTTKTKKRKSKKSKTLKRKQ